MNRLRLTHSLCALVLAASAPPLAALQQQTGPATTMTIVESDNDDGYGIDTTIPFAPSGGVVDLTLVSGEITVTGWSRPEAHIHVSSEETPVRFEYGANRILLDTHTARHRYQDDGDIQYNLTVPVGTRVLMHSTSGDLRSQGTHGEIEARSISGDVEVEDVVRSATLESVSGNVKARGIDGDARARSVSGDVDLDRVHGDITLSSISGHGYVSEARARAVRMETVSGDLSYAGTFDAAGTYDFRAHSGDIRLELPPDVGAIVSMDTFSGDVRTDFPLTIQPGDREPGPNRHHIDTTIGKGGAHITVSTFSGDIQLLRSMGHSKSE